MPYCPECSAALSGDAKACPTCGASLVSTPTAAPVGPSAPPVDVEALRADLAASLAPTYELLKPLGEGGMGMVFLAREPALKRLVAVKLLAPYLAGDARSRARFEREARAAAALSHPNVVRVYSVGETAGQKLPYIVMQYVEGQTLAAWMQARRKVGEREARRIVGEVAAALAAAHARGLVHRDVKPSNVLIEAESGRAYVADFGVAAAMSREVGAETTKLTGTGMVLGTPVYMSPEQAAADEVTPKSDVYSLGVLAYELLAGELPFTAATPMGWAAAHLRDAPTPLAERRADVSPEVVLLVDRCLAKEPGARPPADEVARGMLPSLASEVQWPPPGLHVLHGRGRTRARLSGQTALGGLTFLFALAFTPKILLVHPHWLERFRPAAEAVGESFGASNEAGQAGAVSFFAWQTLLVLSFAAFVLAVSALFGELRRTLKACVEQRLHGWRWTTLVDVLADPDGRGGAILAGGREFASLGADARQEILLARRWSALATVGAGAWVALVLGAWSLAVALSLMSSDPIEPVAGAWVWVAGLVPALLAVGFGHVFRLHERRLLGPLARRAPYAGSETDAAAWYQSVGDAALRPERAPPQLKRRFLIPHYAAKLGVAVVVLVMTEALLAALASAHFTERHGPTAARLAADLEWVEREDPLGAARRFYRPYLPAQHSVPESAERSAVKAFVSAFTPSARGALLAMGGGPRFAAELRRARQGTLSPDTIALLRNLDAEPSQALYRRLARMGAARFFAAMLPESGQALDTAAELPRPQYWAAWWAARANLAGALPDLSRHSLDVVTERIGENAVMVEHLLREPSDFAGTLDLRSLLRHAVLEPLSAFEEVRGNRVRADSIRAVVAAVNRMADLEWRVSGSAADPERMEDYLAALRSTKVNRARRLAWLENGWMGFCANPREILLGPSAVRRSRMRAAAELVADIPYGRDLAARYERRHADGLGSIYLYANAPPRWLAHPLLAPLRPLLRAHLCFLLP